MSCLTKKRIEMLGSVLLSVGLFFPEFMQMYGRYRKLMQDYINFQCTGFYIEAVGRYARETSLLGYLCLYRKGEESF